LVLGTAFCANIETIRRGLESLTGTDLFSAEIYFLSQIPAEMDPVEVALSVVLALGLSLLATLYPSWRAAHLDPVEVLRYE
jgi:lipoprotein-releasing system permease protein